MKALSGALILLVSLNAPAQTGGNVQSAQTVSVLAVGTNGEEYRDCRVHEFFDLGSKEERSELFQGLTGRNVPFGKYAAYVSCNNSKGATTIVTVDKAESLVVISSAPHVADYAPGHGPQFHVAISNWRELNRPWVQLIGVFNDYREVSEAHRETGEAGLPIELPGSYILTIFDGGRPLCRQPLRIDSIGGRLTVQARTTCLLQSSAGVQLQDSRGFDSK